MSAAIAQNGLLSSPRNRALAALFAVALSLAIAIGIYNRGGFNGLGNGGASDVARNAINRINALGDTVAGLFQGRSPGDRADGILANMKQRKRPALHQRALPKVRPGPLASIVGAAPLPPALPPVAAPLYNSLTDTPKVALPGAPVGFTPTPGGPGIFPGFSPLPGGGGVIVPPPVTISPPETPVTPTIPITPTAPVPEPASWLMMLVGFTLIGSCLRRRTSLSPLPT